MSASGASPSDGGAAEWRRKSMLFRSIQFKSDVGLGKIALAAFGLGFVMAIHAMLLLYCALADHGASSRWVCLTHWCLYMVALTLFHLSEFLLTASFKPTSVSYESFLLNHSKEYHLALVVSWIEFAIEIALFPSIKTSKWVLCAGLACVIVGQFFRIAAMATAASNFSHRIEYHKRKEHTLITHGVYRFIRHPSYLGWFVWTVGSQILLGNPICSLGYAFVSWTFFRDRIPYEERILLDFFPEEYPAYMQRSITGVPFVSGVNLQELLRHAAAHKAMNDAKQGATTSPSDVDAHES